MFIPLGAVWGYDTETKLFEYDCKLIVRGDMFYWKNTGEAYGTISSCDKEKIIAFKRKLVEEGKIDGL